MEVNLMDLAQATPRDGWRSKRHRMTTAPGSLAWWRFGLGAGCAALVACTASAEDVRPPSDQLFFPSGLVVSPDQRFLFVANANSELRYDSGSISVIRLEDVQAAINSWTPLPTRMPPADPVVPDGCTRDVDHRETVFCDATRFIDGSAGVRIGNFATDIALQDFSPTENPAKLRVIVPTRGDPSIAWADFVDEKLTCIDGAAEPYALCDDAHRLTTVRNDPNMSSIPNEPFGVFADSANGFAMVTHQSSGAVTLVDSRPDQAAQIVDIKAGLFASDSIGVRAATGIAGRTPGTVDNIVYVGSRTDDRIQTLTVGRVSTKPNNPQEDLVPAYLLTGNFFFLNAVGGPVTGGSSDTRSLQFSPTGNRLYVVNRNPPTLQIYDTSPSPTGVPRNVAAGASDICRQASTVAVFGAGDAERAYVTCFQDGQLYIVDPRGQSQVEDIITVGRGPYGVAAVTAPDRAQLFISNFLENTLAVVDVRPDSPTRNRVVLRIGQVP
jgi:DNA-binding beta-propeller fold protein YncE